MKIACPGDLKRRVGQAIIIAKYVEKLIDNKRPPMAFRPLKKTVVFSLRNGRKSEGKRGVSGGCGNVVNP